MINCGDLTYNMNNMNKKKASGRKNKNKNNRQRKVVSYDQPSKGLPLYMRERDDVLKLHIKTARSLVNRSLGLANYVLPMAFGTSAPGVIYLNDLADILLRLSFVYSHFMVINVQVKGLLTTPYTGNGFGIVGYEASTTTSAVAPTTVADVSNSVHHAIITNGNPGTVSFSPGKYFNDWKVTENSDNEAGTAGVIQILGSNVELAAAPALLLDFSFDIYFSGYRQG